MLSNLIPKELKRGYHFGKAVVAAAANKYPAKKLTVIGVTGTDGKTTTSTYIYHILKKSGHKTALISTVAAYIGDKKIDTGFHVTSPDPGQIQKLLAKIADQGYQYVVLESTSHGLYQFRLFATNIKYAVLTNITSEHLDYHKNLEQYAKAKAQIFADAKFAFVNQSDPSYNLVKNHISSTTKVIDYQPKKWNKSMKASLSKIPEPYNQLNAAAAWNVASQLGLEDKQIAAAIKTIPAIPGRMQKINNNLGINLVVDFAHTPNSIEKTLRHLKKTNSKKLIAVFGSAGLRDQKKRPLMGQAASKSADIIILTAEDPRTENVWAIMNQISEGVTLKKSQLFKIPDRQKAINFALQIAKKGDTVAVLGKGHEQSMCFGTTETPWSDQEATKKAIKQKTKKWNQPKK